MTDMDNSMSSLLMQAAQSAAQADGLLPPGLAQANAAQLQAQQQHQQQQQQQNSGGKKKGPPLRRGKWTPEEEAYANRLIQEFKAGLLPLTDGTTLRTFLSKLLNCDPMRISKKFVGSNCIGKQVFRRRTADLNRLTPEQIQKSRTELSELERRFLDRVAQTNRVKSSGVGAGGGGNTGGASLASGGQANNNVASANNIHNNNTASAAAMAGNNNDYLLSQQQQQQEPPSPPWLQPPLGYKHGVGAAFAAANLSGANSRAAAAGRALLGNPSMLRGGNANGGNAGGGGQNNLLNSGGSDFLAELQRRASHQSLLQGLQQQRQSSASNLLAAATAGSGLSISHLARNSSAARLAGLGVGNASAEELMLKSGFSREQLSNFARDRSGLSSGSLSNMIQRQSSFDALMSLDFQSIQSIDNLANLIQNGGGSHVPETGFRNADFNNSSRFGLSSSDLLNANNSSRRLASAGRMESLLRTFSANGGNNYSAANLSNLLQSMQGNLNNLGGGGAGTNDSNASFLGGGGQSSVSLANFLRQDSGTGLTALRMQDGLNSQRNSSVDDFLSLVAAGDIPHQDPSLLNVPLLQQQQGQLGGNSDSAAKFLAQQQLLQSGHPALSNALSSRSFGSFIQAGGGGLSSSGLSALANNSNKRRLDDLSGFLAQQGEFKR